MPCKDTTSKIAVLLDGNDCLIRFDFTKLTCQKPVGGGTGFNEFCQGKTVAQIVQLEFNKLIEVLKLVDEELQFFLFLEWDALGAALDQYQGKQVDTERYQIATIAYESNQVEINQMVVSPKEMPKLVPCRKRVS
jgi:hypothetical protein